jgi:hypothetical protein
VDDEQEKRLSSSRWEPLISSFHVGGRSDVPSLLLPPGRRFAVLKQSLGIERAWRLFCQLVEDGDAREGYGAYSIDTWSGRDRLRDWMIAYRHEHPELELPMPPEPDPPTEWVLGHELPDS